MDERFLISDPPRELPQGLVADRPPVTIAWRAMRRENHRREAERQRTKSAELGLDAAFVAMAEVACCLAKSGQAEMAGRLRAALVLAGVSAEFPEGEDFVEPWTDLFDNIAALPQPDLTVARITEIVAPAIVRHGVLLRRGKAVIAVPAQPVEKNPGGSESRAPDALTMEQMNPQPDTHHGTHRRN